MSGFFAFIMANYAAILIAIVGVIGASILLLKALIVFFLIIPGPQPESFFQGLADRLEKISEFLAKYSRK